MSTVNHFFFLALLKVTTLVRGSLQPVLVYILPLLSRRAARRLNFENKNNRDDLSRSFSRDNLKADIAFEVSSEGELEHVRPIIDQLIAKNYLIELIYASESVEKRCLDLAHNNLNNIRIFRLPILSFGFDSKSLVKWMTAKKLVLCRYDFYPELLLYGLKKEVTFTLVSGTLKSKEGPLNASPFNLKNLFFKSYYKWVYGLFDHLVVASKDDADRFALLLGKRSCDFSIFDFRVMQVKKRVLAAKNTLEQKQIYSNFEAYLNDKRSQSSLIMGSAWPVEMEIFNNTHFLNEIRSGKIFVAIAPHHLSSDSLSAISTRLTSVLSNLNIEVPIYHLKKELTLRQTEHLFESMNSNPGVLIISIPGILCEMYTLFDDVFVGGGHGRSIHSVLEPYLAQTQIYCGPKVFRSTEYDFVKNNSPKYIHLVKDLSSFYNVYRKNVDVSLDKTHREEIIESFDQSFFDLMQLFYR